MTAGERAAGRKADVVALGVPEAPAHWPDMEMLLYPELMVIVPHHRDSALKQAKEGPQSTTRKKEAVVSSKN